MFFKGARCDALAFTTRLPRDRRRNCSKLPETIQFKIEPNLTTQFFGVKMDVFQIKIDIFQFELYFGAF